MNIIRILAVVVIVSAIAKAALVAVQDKTYPNWEINTAIWATMYLMK